MLRKETGETEWKYRTDKLAKIAHELFDFKLNQLTLLIKEQLYNQ